MVLECWAGVRVPHQTLEVGRRRRCKAGLCPNHPGKTAQLIEGARDGLRQGLAGDGNPKFRPKNSAGGGTYLIWVP